MRYQSSALSVSPPFSFCPRPPLAPPTTSKHRQSQRAHVLRLVRPHHPQQITDQARELVQNEYSSASLQPPHSATPRTLPTRSRQIAGPY